TACRFATLRPAAGLNCSPNPFPTKFFPVKVMLTMEPWAPWLGVNPDSDGKELPPLAAWAVAVAPDAAQKHRICTSFRKRLGQRLSLSPNRQNACLRWPHVAVHKTRSCVARWSRLVMVLRFWL